MKMTESNQNSCCSDGTDKVQNILNVLDIRILINEPLCTGCGLCGELCPFGLPKPSDNGKYEIMNPELCTECSACQRNCPTNAIIMREHVGCGCLWNARQQAKSKGNSCNCS